MKEDSFLAAIGAMVAGMLSIIIFFFVVHIDNEVDAPDIPRCAEDSIIVGGGDYEDGMWEYYACGHPDTLGG